MHFSFKRWALCRSARRIMFNTVLIESDFPTSISHKPFRVSMPYYWNKERESYWKETIFWGSINTISAAINKSKVRTLLLLTAPVMRKWSISANTSGLMASIVTHLSVPSFHLSVNILANTGDCSMRKLLGAVKRLPSTTKDHFN